MKQGMRFALRSLARTPTFTAVAILTLAVGIGTNTTIFAIVDELALKPARGRATDGVYHLFAIQIPDYETLAANPPEGVSAIAAFESVIGLLQIPGRAARVVGARVSGGYANVHSVRAQVGRWINDADNIGGAVDPTLTRGGVTAPFVFGQLGADVCVISDRIWREWFGASRDVVGRTITLDHKPVRVVGVAPARFEVDTDIWTPFGRRRLFTREELEKQRPTRRPTGWMGPLREPTQPRVQVMLRKAPGASDAAVNGRLTAAVAARVATPDMPVGPLRIRPRTGDDRLVRTGYIILGFAALIFVAACANLGNMLFARATEREGELAVRLSLGATRFDIFGLLFAESVFICAAGALAGLAFAAGVLQLFTDAFPAFQVSYWRSVALDLSIDWRISGYATAAGLVAAIVVGAGSLWRSSRVSLLARLAAAGPAVVAKTEGRTLRTMLVSVQVTAAVLLLIVTGMMLENTSKRLNRRLLFDTGSLVAAKIELPDTYDEARGRHFYAQLLARVRSIAGVTAAGLADALPGGEAPAPRRAPSAITAEAPPQGLSGVPKRLNAQWIHASPGLFETLGVRLTRGRDFLATDDAGTDPVVVITESAASRLWPGEDPLRKRLTCCRATYLRRVVGVVSDPIGALNRPLSHNLGEAISEASGDDGQGVFAFLPAAQRYSAGMLVVLRSTSPGAAIQPLREAVVALDAEVPVFGAGPVMATQFTRAGSEKGVRVLAGALGAISLGIAVVGVYAIVSYFVSRRTREFGLRLALGSTRRQIVKLVVDYAVHIVLIGLLPGVLLASVGTRYFQNELRQLQPNGLTVWVGVPVLMLVVGIIAAYIPARRAARVDPYKALKEL
jgi:predicted permease